MRRNILRVWLGMAVYVMTFGAVLAELPPTVRVDFYSTSFELPQLFCSELEMPEEMGREIIVEAYEHFENCSHADFLSRLEGYRDEYGLADWHCYEVLCRVSEKTYKDKRFQVLFQWFALRKMGIDAQIFYQGPSAFLHAQCTQAEFGFYTIEHHGRKYINLTARRDGLKLSEGRAYLPDIMLDGLPGRPFSLRIHSLPNLPQSERIERVLEFAHKGQRHHLKVVLNGDHLHMMDDYPYYSQVQYFDLDMSAEARESLLPQLRAMLKGRSQTEQVELLLSFVRTAFFYKDDRRKYGKEKPMTPEQTLYHSYSDCEDRSALFFYLLKDLLKLPAIVLDFEAHVGVAVELEGAKGNYFMHKEKRFVYCEATGPDDKLAIGEMWEDVKKMKARVMTDFIPD